MRSCNTLNTQSAPLIRQVQAEVKRQRKKKPGRAPSARKSRPGLRLITRGLYLKTGPAPLWLLMFQHRHRRYRKVIGDAGVIFTMTSRSLTIAMFEGAARQPAVRIFCNT